MILTTSPDLDVEEKNIMKIRADEQYSRGVRYNWIGLFKAYVFRKFRILRFLKSNSSSKDITVSDLLFSNKLTLIEYV